MRIQREYMSIENHWLIRYSYDFQAHQQGSHRRYSFSQTSLLWFSVLLDLSPAFPGLLSVYPGASKVRSGTLRCFQTRHIDSHGTPGPVFRDPSYSEGRPECPPRVSYFPEVDVFKFTLHILPDTPACYQWQKYILLMYILSIGRSILSQRRTMNASLRCWYPRWHPIKRLNDWVCPLMIILTKGRIQMKPVSNWLHGDLETIRDISRLLMTWQAWFLAQNTTPRQLFHACWQWSWHVWSQQLSITGCLWIPLPQMRWRTPRFIVGGMRKSPGLIQPRKSQTLQVPTFQW